jgi:3-oxoacyl-[acyl-carrier protein] reductase
VLLKDKVAIVTGGAMGIGRGVALKFAEEGGTVVVADISEAEGKKTAAEITEKGGRGLFLACDVTSAAGVSGMVAAAVKEFGQIDILVNNAGGVPGIQGATLEDVTEDEWHRFIDLNLTSVFLCCKTVVPYMKQRSYGKIVNFSSMGAVRPSVSVVHYHAAKAGVIGLTYNLAFELAPFNIYVNAVLPGPVRTPFWTPVLKDMPNPDAYFAEIGRKEIPLGRIGTPEDIAGAVLFFASDLSSYVSGEVMHVAGGQPQLAQAASSTAP